MKFLALALLGLTGLASAQNLRTIFSSQQAASDGAASSSVINTSVIVQGLKADEATEADQHVITQAVVAAYRQVYKVHSSDEMLGGCGGWGCGSVGVGWNPWNNFKWFFYMISWDCDFCPNDDDTYRLTSEEADERTVFAMASFNAAVPGHQDLALHRNFERAVCNNIRKLGSAALQGARGCAVGFYDLDFPGCDAGRKEILVKIEGVAVQEEDVDKIEAAAKAAGLQNFVFETVASTSSEPLGSIIFAEMDLDCDGVSAIDIAGTFCLNLKAQGLEGAHDCELATYGNAMVSNAGTEKQEEM